METTAIQTAARGTGLDAERLGAALGAVVRGMRLDLPIDDETIAGIRQELDEHLVLFFENQVLTPGQQRDLAARFGELYIHPFYPGDTEFPEIMILEHDETRRANGDRWHTDATYLETPPQMAVLYSEEIPEVGGDTLWANMYQAFEALCGPLRQMLTTLRAVHSFDRSFTPERFRALHLEDRMQRSYAENPPVSHPVVRTNPANGRQALFVNSDFTSHIEGVSRLESDAILHLLYEHMAQPEFQIRWRWQPQTLVIWDNRWTQHCALADYFPRRRRVRRATIVGDRPT